MSELLGATRTNFRVAGNVQVDGNLIPAHDNLAVGSDQYRFSTIYLHDLSGNTPTIHFGDYHFTGQDVVDAKAAAELAATALQPYHPLVNDSGVSWFRDVVPLGHPTTLTGYGITDAATDEQGAKADSVFNSVLAVSSNWDGTYGSVLATSGDWDTVYANVYNTVTELNGLDVSTSLNVGGDVTITGYISAGDRILGPANMVIDPAAHQDNTGKLSILGDLQVNGTTTTVNQLSSNNIKSSGNVTTSTLDVTDTITIGGRIHGPAEMYIDPAAIGDNTGKLIVLGDLQVDGTTTTVNSTTVTVSGKTLVLAEGSADAAQADNSGIQIQGPDAIFKYFAADDRWKSDRQIKISRSSPALVFDKTDNGRSSVLAHDANGLYFKVTDNSDTTRFMNAGNGTNMLINHNTHRVGINTTTPSVALHVNDTDAIKIPKGTTAERPSATTATHQGYIRYNTTTNQFEGFGAGNSWGSLGGVMDVDQDTYISPEASPGADDDALRFFTSGLERARIDSNGKVGIGTNTAQQRLHVYHDPMRVSHNIGANTAYTLLNFASDRTIDDYGGVNSVYWRVNLQTPSNDHRRGDLRFGAKTNVSDSTIVDRVTFTHDGKVGIGTTSPTRNLEVAGNFRSTKTSVDGGEIGLDFNVGGAADHPVLNIYDKDGNDGARIRANGDSWISAKGGNVGIGTTNPDNLLSVDGNISIWNGNRLWLKDGADIGIENDAGDNAFYIKNVGAAGSSVLDLGSGKMVIEETSGNVGIGTTNPATKLHVRGDNGHYLNVGDVYLSTRGSSDAWGGYSAIFRGATAIDPNSQWLGIGATSTYGWLSYGSIDKHLIINSAGNVGIGTTNPVHVLEVATPNGKYGHHVVAADGITSLGGLFLSASVDGGGLELYLKQPGETKVRISSNSTRPTYFNSGSNVGIGTTNPVRKLHLKQGQIKFENTSTGDWAGLDFSMHNGTYVGYMGMLDSDGRFFIDVNNDGDDFVILQNGNVGIGTTSPGAKLDIHAATNTNGLLIREDTDDSITHNFYIDNADNGAVLLYANGQSPEIKLNTAGDSYINGGKVGIGTTSPETILDINEPKNDSNGDPLNKDVIMTFSKGDTGEARIGLAGMTSQVLLGALTDDLCIRSDGNNIRFGTASATRTDVTIDTAGKVGIGTTNPLHKLHVRDGVQDGNMSVGGSHNIYGLQFSYEQDGPTLSTIKANTNYNNAATLLKISTNNNTDQLVLKGDGNVGIGTANPVATLDVPVVNTKVTRFGDDVTSHYVVTGQTNHTLTFTCGSYYQAEVVITAHQTNSSSSGNNLYIRGIWHNNYTNHAWNELEHVGQMSNSTITITNTHNGGNEENGKLIIQHNYSGASFARLTVRITDFFGTHSYTLT